MKSDLVEQSAKGVPAVAGAATAILTVNQWLGFLTVIYIVVQILYLLRKWYREEKDWHKKFFRPKAPAKRVEADE